MKFSVIVIAVAVEFLILPFTECKDVRWKWQAGSTSVNKVSSDLNLGARTGGMVFKDTNTYNTFFLFGGLLHDPISNSQCFANDLWHVEGGGPSEKVLHQGTRNEGSKRGTGQSPVPRMLGASCGIAGGMFMVYGGYGDKGALGDTWIYDFGHEQWSSLEKLHFDMNHNDTSLISPPARSDMAAWCMHDRLVIFGGIGEKSETMRDMWEFDLRTLSWKEMENSVLLRSQIYFNHLTTWPEARNGATTWVKGKNLYLFGGNRVSNHDRKSIRNVGFSSDLYMYNISEGKWRYVHGRRETGRVAKFTFHGQHSRENEPGCRRGGAGIVDTSGNLWLFGGEGADGHLDSVSSVKPPKRLADLWHFDVLKNEWAFKGGFERGNSAGIYNGDKNIYYTGSQPGSRFDTMSVPAGNTILVYGGIGIDADGNEGLLSDFWEIDMHNYVAYFSATYPGTVFNLLFWPFLFVAVICVSFLYSRKFFEKFRNKRDIAYAPLTQE
ncbi:uncharacterized protein LOC132555203 [Ylistrum balloti]|uniref:uncharacterized protein LOC132555203 n=1 Tax=Ylistrum balloti TaxID=509963 RepID=UPI002905B6DE|nr:uncharacterized protein LOC132555203 [Ylistrum balloti]